MALVEYTWVMVLALFFSFLGAFGIGANDVANAFATSVGAKSITVKQAVCIAAIFEFGGAFFMGSHVAKTIRKGICDLDLFQENENDAAVLMFGMMCVTFSVAVWLLVATWASLPISTTHTCVGSIMGMVIAAKGWDAVNWDVVVKIVLSWLFSPIFSGIFAVFIWKVIKHAIMRAEDPKARTLMFYPILVAFCTIIVVFYTIYKGSPQLKLKETKLWVACVWSFGIGLFAAACTWAFALPQLEERMDRKIKEKIESGELIELGGGKIVNEDDEEAPTKRDAANNIAGSTNNEEDDQKVDEFDEKTEKNITESADELALKPTTKSWTDSIIPDVEKNFHESAEDQVLEMLSRAEQFDPKAELAFSYLQVFSACFDAFAHGANDVANSIGPMAAVYVIWDTEVVEKESDMPLWILAIGSIGIVVGLALYGYNIIEAIGFRLTKLSPSRGFSIELGAALVVLTGSRLEIPLSTTHCQVGATVGVGMSEDLSGVNWYLLLKVVAGWIFTLVVAAVVTCAVFSYAVYSPRV